MRRLWSSGFPSRARSRQTRPDRQSSHGVGAGHGGNLFVARTDAGKVATRLKKEKGAAFDKDYIDTEVAYHQAVIGAVRDVLVPGAQNPDLKRLLETAIPTLEGHLQHAKMVQAQLGKSASK